MISTAWKLSWFCYESTIGHVSRWWKLAWKGSHRRGDAWSEACRMIQEFFVWWGEQLASLVPDTLRRSFSSVDQTILLSYDEAASSIDAELRNGKRGGLLGRFSLDERGLAALAEAIDRIRPGTKIVLRLPPGLMLEKHLQIPQAAQRDLMQVVRYELDRETPFTPDEVYWAVAILAKDRSLGQITACLTLVVKAEIDPILDALRRAGIDLAALVDKPEGTRIPLGGKTGVRALFVDPTRIGRGPLVGGLVAVLVMAAIIGPFLRQNIALSRAEAQITALQADADSALALRRQNGGVGSDAGDPQSAVGNPLLMLAAITDALPDDTYLSDFTLHHREISLMGQSRDAAALIQRLSDNSVVRDPGFSAPVTRDPGTGVDNCSIKLSARQP